VATHELRVAVVGGLFYLLLYVLEREADDAGLFAHEVALSPSTFVPEEPQLDDEGSQADGEG
jgi:hypothetical protein